MKKGSILVAIPIILAVASFTIATMITMPYVFLKIHIVKVIEYQYSYDNAQQSLLTMFATDTSHALPKYILGIDSTQNKKIVEEKLNIIVPKSPTERQTDKPCYKLSSSKNELIQPKLLCNPEFKTKTKIPLPYSPDIKNLVDEVELVIK